MPLIIDGNNLLHTPMPPALAGLGESRLCQLLTRTAWAGQRMVVVCDGAPGPLRAADSPVDAVELIHAGRGRSADDVIIELINADTAPKRLTVVSSDHQIRKAARRRRARVMTSDKFVLVLAAAGSGRGGPASHRSAKPAVGPLTEHEIEHWLDTFGIEPPAHDQHQDASWEEDVDERL